MPGGHWPKRRARHAPPWRNGEALRVAIFSAQATIIAAMSERKTKSVACPTCGKPVEWTPENRFRPFCGERCRLIDLGEWFKEERRIPGREPSPAPEEDGDWNQ